MNSTNSLDHLNDDQFTALLAGEPMTEAQAHLDACAECRQEMACVAESMGSFSALTLDWAERKAATMPPVKPTAGRTWLRPLAWASAATLLAVGIYVGEQHQAAARATAQNAPGAAAALAQTPVQPTTSLTREEQIAADNRLLLAIRQELSRPNPVLPASLRRARPARAVND
jgi:hypothetical protein